MPLTKPLRMALPVYWGWGFQVVNWYILRGLPESGGWAGIASRGWGTGLGPIFYPCLNVYLLFLRIDCRDKPHVLARSDSTLAYYTHAWLPFRNS